jgi:hypothetical protein
MISRIARRCQPLLVLGTVLFFSGGVLVMGLSFLSAQSPEEDEEESSHVEDSNRPSLSIDDLPRATPYARPDESLAQSVDSGRLALKRNDSLRDVIEAIEAGDIDGVTALIRSGNYCGQRLREPLPECNGLDTVKGLYSGQLIIKDPILKPVETVEEWLAAFFAKGQARLEFASRDSRLSEGDGGKYYLVFRGEKSLVFGAGNEYDKLAVVVTPGTEEPIESFAFLVVDGNGLRWIQQLGGDDGARHQRLILPESVADLPGWFGS